MKILERRKKKSYYPNGVTQTILFYREKIKESNYNFIRDAFDNKICVQYDSCLIRSDNTISANHFLPQLSMPVYNEYTPNKNGFCYIGKHHCFIQIVFIY